MKITHIRITFAGIIALLGVSGQLMAQHPLDSWAPRAVPTPNSALRGVAYGNGTFVAVGDNSFVARSTDGITWTTGTAGAYGTLKRVRFLNGQFVAVGSSDKILFSSDGASWTANTVSPETDFWDVAWGNGVYVIAGSAYGARAYASSNGMNWTFIHPMAYSDITGQWDAQVDTVVFANGGFLATPTRFSNRLNLRSSFSTNGLDWVLGAIGYISGEAGAGELVYQNGVWLSTVTSSFSGGNGVLLSTNNGVSWTFRFNSASFNGSRTLAAAEGYFVFFDNGSVYVSTNGYSWNSRYSGNGQLRSAAFGNGTFVGVGYVGNQSYVLQSGDVSGAPIILQEPEDRSAVADNPATFTVEVVGGLPLWYQWYRDGTAISGATNASYSIAHVSTSDIGGYHAIITNSINSVTSRVAQLTVSFLGISQYAGIKILGVPGRTYQIDATPVSGAPNWQTLTNLPLPSSPYIWIDYDSPTMPSRIYRAAELP